MLHLKGHDVQVSFLRANFRPHKIIYYNTSNELILVSSAFALFYFYSLTYRKRNECHFYQWNKLQPALNLRYVSAISTSSSSGSRGRLLGRLRGQIRLLRPMKTGSISVAEKDENIPWFGNSRLCDGGLFHVGRRLQNGLQLVQLLEEALVGSHAAPPTVDVSEGISARRECQMIFSTKNVFTTKNHTHSKTWWRIGRVLDA